MSARLVLITEIISPYRIPLFNALAQSPEIDLHVIFLAETDPGLREWPVYKEQIRFSYQVLRSWRYRIGGYNALLNVGMVRALGRARPALVLCGGYNYVGSWQALIWARAHQVPFFLWSESNLQDQRGGHALIEFLKSEFLHHCSGFVVPGKTARRYLLGKKIREGNIFTAVNAVDNDGFRSAASVARQRAGELRREMNLPQRYLLYVGRLVAEKGVFELLSAYAKLDRTLRAQVGLVFAGSGAARRSLEQQAALISREMIRFAGFLHGDRLASVYALAEMLILPTYTDPWGLVVNEGMACGLPVIVSHAAGCAEDLVTEHENGYVVPPRDVEKLATKMQILADHSDLRAAMGDRSLQRIESYTPQKWSEGIVLMAKTAVGESRV